MTANETPHGKKQQQYEAEAQHILHVFGPNYVLTQIDEHPPVYQLTRQDRQQHVIAYQRLSFSPGSFIARYVRD